MGMAVFNNFVKISVTQSIYLHISTKFKFQKQNFSIIVYVLILAFR